MIYFPLLLAWRYLRGAHHEKSLTTMAKISFLGIFIGTFCLALVATIMRGFEKATYQAIQGCNASLTIQSHGNQLALEPLEKVLKKEFPNLPYSPSDVQFVMTQNQAETISNLVALKGVDPHLEATTTELEKKIMDAAQSPASMVAILKENKVLIGHRLAQLLKLQVDDSFTAYFVPDHEIGNATITLEKTEFIVGGIFKTGIEEFDSNLIICSLEQLHTLFPNSGVTAISVACNNVYNEKELKERLKKRLNLPVYSWQDRYPALVAALTLETYASFIILTLIVLVASMSILSLLFMHITQKRSDIALLKTVGTPLITIRSVFMIMGMAIALSASLLGLVVAYLVGWLLHHYIIIELPDAYYVTHLPVALDLSIFFIVFLVVIAISFLATWLPTRSIAHINIADVLRFET